MSDSKSNMIWMKRREIVPCRTRCACVWVIITISPFLPSNLLRHQIVWDDRLAMLMFIDASPMYDPKSYTDWMHSSYHPIPFRSHPWEDDYKSCFPPPSRCDINHNQDRPEHHHHHLRHYGMTVNQTEPIQHQRCDMKSLKCLFSKTPNHAKYCLKHDLKSCQWKCGSVPFWYWMNELPNKPWLEIWLWNATAWLEAPFLFPKSSSWS